MSLLVRVLIQHSNDIVFVSQVSFFREELYYEPVSASYTKCPLDQLIADVGRGDSLE